MGTNPFRGWRSALQVALAIVGIGVAACGRSTPPGDLPADNASSTPETLVDLDSLPSWKTDVDLELGRDRLGDVAFVHPAPLGSDDDGDIYVLDRSQMAVFRFDSEGEFLGEFIRHGQGPGEIWSTPRSFGLSGEYIWHEELATGRVHYISLADGTDRVVETGMTPARLATLGIWVTPLSNREDFHFRVTRGLPDATTIRPREVTQHLLMVSGQLDTIFEYQAIGPTIVLDGGGTNVTFPGPNNAPVVLFDKRRGRFLRLERPVASDASNSVIDIEVSDGHGAVERRGRLRVPPVYLSSKERGRIRDVLQFRASWGGGRALEREVERQLNEIVETIPRLLPAFEDAVLGGDGSLWLRLPAREPEREVQSWLVVDTSLRPMAVAQLPRAVIEVLVGEDHEVWAVIQSELEERYVVRLSVEPPRSSF